MGWAWVAQTAVGGKTAGVQVRVTPDQVSVP
jgi:hypothetical protein